MAQTSLLLFLFSAGNVSLIDDTFYWAKLGRSDSVSGNKLTYLSVITWPGSFSVHLVSILDYRLIGKQGDAPSDTELELTRGLQRLPIFTTKVNILTWRGNMSRNGSGVLYSFGFILLLHLHSILRLLCWYYSTASRCFASKNHYLLIHHWLSNTCLSSISSPAFRSQISHYPKHCVCQ